MTSIFEATYHDGYIQLGAAWWLILLVALLLLIALVWKKRAQIRSKSYFEIDEAEIGIGNSKVKLRPNYEDYQVAFSFWTELATRKLGIPIDEENDVIVEVYNSWYEFFGVARELIKAIPVSKLQHEESTKEIVDISVKLLNSEIRPHLTRWQARYRRWWDTALLNEANVALSPQEIQRTFPQYNELMKDMKEVNRKLIAYTDILHRMIHQ